MAKKSSSLTISDYAERWLQEAEAVVKPATIEIYRRQLRIHLLPDLGSLRIAEIDRSRVRTLLAEKLSGGLARNTVRLIYATLRAVLNSARDDGLIEHNPADKLGRKLRLVQAVEQDEKIRAFDRAQLSLFLDACLKTAPRLYALFYTMSRTGLRIGEALALKIEDVDFGRREIRVARTVSNTRLIGRPKSGHSRSVDMSRGTQTVLEAHMVTLSDKMSEWLFPSAAMTTLCHVNVERAFKSVLRDANLPLHHTPHSLRHTFASLLIQAGIPIDYVKRMLGHASIQMTVDTYGKWLPHGNKAAVDGLDDTIVLDHSPTYA